ncbi:MAG: type II toxin-antitoxin system RelE/ParE family toxin [Synergistaceae bacterium]|nr:type II toxin-antitoxin system RelE/ParE family toxin [Synergistaceae bacterium]
MKYRFRFLQLAQNDLQDVIDYIAQHSLKAANDFLDELDKRLLQICEFPKLCEVYRHNPTLRRLIIDNYLIFYEADEENKVINVYRILHSSRNIEKINLLDI